MKMRRVVVTGIGCISSLGNDSSQYWQALAAGKCGIRKLETLPIEQLKVAIGAEVQAYNALDFFNKRQLGLLDRCSQFALISAREALTDAGIDFSADEREKTAVILGTAGGGKTTEDDTYKSLYHDGKSRVNPFSIPRAMPSAAPSQVTMEFGIHGPAFTVSSACSSANHAIGQAFWMVRNGNVDAAITGGCEASFTLGMMKSWEALRVLSPDLCRPFSNGRRGMVLGEGAGILILESLEKARARGATIYAEIAGFGMSSDASHITQPSVDGASQAVKAALTDAEMNINEVDYVNAHGTGTQANDASETQTLHQVFGEHARKLKISSTKSMHGHALGASGAFELVATVLAMKNSLAPPTINYLELDPACDLDYVPNVAVEHRIKAAVSNSFAFGGLNAVIAVRAVD